LSYRVVVLMCRDDVVSWCCGTVVNLCYQ